MSLTADSMSIADQIARDGGRQVRRYVNESVSRTAREAGANELEPCDFVCECGSQLHGGRADAARKLRRGVAPGLDLRARQRGLHSLCRLTRRPGAVLT